jgi:uncharacterized protein
MVKALLIGIVFGIILQRSRVNTYNKIGGIAMLKDFTAIKVILTAIGVGSILFFIEIQLGVASLSIKPFPLMGILSGGVIFGIGMAVLGYCPGTLICAIGEGSLDAGIGLIGGLSAGFVYILLYPYIGAMLGPDLGKLNLYAQNPLVTALVVFLFGSFLIFLAFFIDRKEGGWKIS